MGRSQAHAALLHWCISADGSPGVIFFLPGTLLSNSAGCMKGTGHVGSAGRSLVGVSSGWTTVGVTMTISSVMEWFRLLERNSCPRMGYIANTGNLAQIVRNTMVE